MSRNVQNFFLIYFGTSCIFLISYLSFTHIYKYLYFIILFHISNIYICTNNFVYTLNINFNTFFYFPVTDVTSQQNQFFRVKPSNADVAEGGTAIIACEVANRRGRVQWTKDGLTLGNIYFNIPFMMDLFKL